MDKLKELISKCKCSVMLSINDHRDNYETVEQYLRRNNPEIEDPEIVAKMIETDTIICLIFYPNTPIGSCEIYHYDLDRAFDEALKVRSLNPPYCC